MFVRKLAPILSSLLLLASPVTTNSSSTARFSQDLAQTEANKIVNARELLRGYVLDIKEKYKPLDKEYLESKKRYREAQRKVAGWVTTLTLAIKKGNEKDLRKDEQYLVIARDAGEASKEFAEYAQHATVETKGIFAFATAIVDIGLKIWNEKREREAKEREKYADAFQKEVKWERWEEIKQEPPKP
jgi:hypothetical protein